jgi:hypothetical protein
VLGVKPETVAEMAGGLPDTVWMGLPPDQIRYCVTPTVSVDAPQDRVRLVDPMLEQLGLPGVLGLIVSGGPVIDSASRSRLGPPLDVVAVARIVLSPALRVTVVETSAQLGHPPVPGKFTEPASAALTEMDIGRLVVLPLA